MARAPAMTPHMKSDMVSGERYSLSHTRPHSDTMVDSASEEGKERPWQREETPRGHWSRWAVSWE